MEMKNVFSESSGCIIITLDPKMKHLGQESIFVIKSQLYSSFFQRSNPSVKHDHHSLVVSNSVYYTSMISLQTFII